MRQWPWAAYSLFHHHHYFPFSNCSWRDAPNSLSYRWWKLQWFQWDKWGLFLLCRDAVLHCSRYQYKSHTLQILHLSLNSPLGSGSWVLTKCCLQSTGGKRSRVSILLGYCTASIPLVGGSFPCSASNATLFTEGCGLFKFNTTVLMRYEKVTRLAYLPHTLIYNFITYPWPLAWGHWKAQTPLWDSFFTILFYERVTSNLMILSSGGFFLLHSSKDI